MPRRAAPALPEKIHEKDVHTIENCFGKNIENSLLTQTEYETVQSLKTRLRPINAKFSRKTKRLGLSKSVIFDTNGEGYALYRGKSLASQLRQSGIAPEDMPYRWDMEEEKILGKGAFGRVKICQAIDTGEWYAVKIVPTISQKFLAGNARSELDRETLSLVHFDRLQGTLQREDGTAKRYLIQKLINGQTLLQWVEQGQVGERIQPDQDLLRLAVAQAVTEAIEDCHRSGMLHRDIKLDNILLEPETNCITLIDFGFSRSVGRALSIKSDTLVGTEGYLAPELRAQRHHAELEYNEATEVYALGIVLGSLLFGENFQKPYRELPYELLQKMGLTLADFSMLSESAARLPENLPWVRYCRSMASAIAPDGLLPAHQRKWAAFIGQLLQKSPQSRPKLAQVHKQLKLMRKELEKHSQKHQDTFFERLFHGKKKRNMPKNLACQYQSQRKAGKLNN